MFVVGLDPGQRRDPSALAVVEREEPRLAWMPGMRARLIVRYLERIPLGTSYPDVVARVCDVMLDPRMDGQSHLVVDATGVGVAVMDLLRLAGMRGRMTAVTITGGDGAHGNGDQWCVPKRELLTGLESSMECGELRIARRLAEAERLVREFESMTMAPRVNGRWKMGAAGEGEHDDLVLALSLACWRAKRPRNGFGTRRLPGI
jgi:hypothetical protein